SIHNCRRRTLPEVELITANKGVTIATAMRRPLTYLQTFILRGATQGSHATNRLMSGKQRIL
ncbi:hypothetical protein, partial [Escherichia coli]